jgi:hypothetical protein
MFRIITSIAATCICGLAKAQSADSCMSEIPSNPSVAPILGKVAMSDGDLTNFKFRVNKDKVQSDEERSAIGVFIEERKKCEVLIRFPNAEIASLRGSFISAFEQGAADLYMGSITYGDCTRFRNDKRHEFDGLAR